MSEKHETEITTHGALGVVNPIERHQNTQHSNYYHTRIRLGCIGTYCLDELANRATVSMFVKVLLEIPGVTWVDVSPYKIRVDKAELFDWSEVEPKVLELIEGLNNATKEPESAK